MKKLLIILVFHCGFLFHLKAQFKLSDLLMMGRMTVNPDTDNSRSFLDAKDSLQMMGYVLMKFVPANKSGPDRRHFFYYQKADDVKKKITIESQDFSYDKKRLLTFKTVFCTDDITTFLAMLKSVLAHPDFEAGPPSLTANNFVSKKSAKVSEKLTFFKMYDNVETGGLKIISPRQFMVTYIREQ